MKKIFAVASVLAILASVAPVMAYTNVRAVMSASGVTELNELSTISGYDWTEGSMQMTGYIHEGVKNEGKLIFNNEITSPGAWEMVEEKMMWGEGDTKFKKEVAWWTEDSSMVNGEMKWPTSANIFAGFYTDTFTDEVEIHNVADEPIQGNPGEYSYNYFLKVWDTDDEFDFVEGVGINLPEDCTPHVPNTWRFPRCDGGVC